MHPQDGRPPAGTPPAAAGAAASEDAAPRLARHWRRTRRLTAVLLALWFVASFVTVFFAAELRQRFFGWPLGFWMASQGALVVYLLIVVLYERAMARIDAEHGVAEER